MSNAIGIRSATAATVAHKNSITGNGTGADGTAIPPTGSMNAQNNWWGCAAGPGNDPECDTVTAHVDASSPATMADPCAPTTTTTTTTTSTTTILTQPTTTTTSTSTTTTTLASPCPLVPRPGCQAALSGRGKLLIRYGRPFLNWRWTSSALVQKSDFGAPDATSDYALCVYDAMGRKVAAAAPAAGVCGSRPCWRAGTTGFRYRDRDLTPDGLQRIGLKAGAAGRGRIMVSGRGSNLHLPPPAALAPPVRVQLIRDDAATCWEATFTLPSQNTSDRFVGQSD